jgi:transcriptional regulator with GAF, ATPase, and Fis domain
MTETIPQMRQRHAAEIRQAVERLASERITQAEAARRNGMNLTAINNLVRRLGIFWPVKRQGVR